jgi:hypothetical protein
MITGRVPFQSDAALEVMTMQIGRPAPPPSTVTPVPRAIEQVVLRALAKEPAERWASADEMLAALDAACAETPDWTSGGAPAPLDPRARPGQLAVEATVPSLAAVAPAEARPEEPPRRRRLRLMVVAGAAAITVAVLAVRQHRRAPRLEIQAAPPAATAAPLAGGLRVVVTPAGRIILDGRVVGTGSHLEIAAVPVGAHRLRAEAAGHLPEERPLVVPAGEPLSVSITLRAQRLEKPSARPHPRRTSKQETDVEAPINPYAR